MGPDVERVSEWRLFTWLFFLVATEYAEYFITGGTKWFCVIIHIGETLINMGFSHGWWGCRVYVAVMFAYKVVL